MCGNHTACFSQIPGGQPEGAGAGNLRPLHPVAGRGACASFHLPEGLGKLEHRLTPGAGGTLRCPPSVFLNAHSCPRAETGILRGGSHPCFYFCKGSDDALAESTPHGLGGLRRGPRQRLEGRSHPAALHPHPSLLSLCSSPRIPGQTPETHGTPTTGEGELGGVQQGRLWAIEEGQSDSACVCVCVCAGGLVSQGTRHRGVAGRKAGRGSAVLVPWCPALTRSLRSLSSQLPGRNPGFGGVGWGRPSRGGLQAVAVLDKGPGPGSGRGLASGSSPPGPWVLGPWAP